MMINYPTKYWRFAMDRKDIARWVGEAALEKVAAKIAYHICRAPGNDTQMTGKASILEMSDLASLRVELIPLILAEVNEDMRAEAEKQLIAAGWPVSIPPTIEVGEIYDLRPVEARESAPMVAFTPQPTHVEINSEIERFVRLLMMEPSFARRHRKEAKRLLWGFNTSPKRLAETRQSVRALPMFARERATSLGLALN